MEGLQAQPWNPARQCTATNRAGERCRRQPIPGGNVCIMHGGGIPAVQEAAKRRLLAMVEPILDVFEEIVTSWHATRCETCGHPTGDPAPVIRVGQLVLDRSGFHPSVTVETVAPPPNHYAHLTDDQMVDQCERLLAEAVAIRDEHRRHALPAAFNEGALVSADIEPPIHEADVQVPLATSGPAAEGIAEK